MKIQKHDAIMSLISGMQMRLGYIGYAKVGTGWQTHQVATAFNRLYLIESGSGILHTDTEELVLEPGKAYLLPAGLACSYHCSDSLSLLFFHFNLSQPDQFDLMRHVKFLSVVEFPADRFTQLLESCGNASYTNAFAVSFNRFCRILRRSDVAEQLEFLAACADGRLTSEVLQLAALTDKRFPLVGVFRDLFLGRSGNHIAALAVQDDLLTAGKLRYCVRYAEHRRDFKRSGKNRRVRCL